MQLVHTPQMQLLRSIIDSVADPIFVKDEAHTWVELNSAFCEFLGHPRDALLGKSDYDFFPRHEADVFWQRDDHVFRSGQDDVNEERLTDQHGVTRTISTKKSVIVDRSGRRLLVGAFRDITALRREERARVESGEHRLDTRIDSRVAGISKIVDDVRALARDAVRDEPVAVTLSTLIKDALRLCGESLRGRGIALRLINRAPGVDVRCRATQIVQLLISILNAVRDAVLGSPSPWIELRMSATGGFTELRVVAAHGALVMEGAELGVVRGLAADNGGSLTVIARGVESGLMLRLPRASVGRRAGIAS
ncbi:MAG: PAS domain S-box protein [Myxococcales bacterium]|nr:PAS domain S-box protein [Myxococcales bacterium]